MNSIVMLQITSISDTVTSVTDVLF